MESECDVTDDLSELDNKALPAGWRLVVVPEVDSTNDEIRRQGTDPQQGEALVVVAGKQSSGRGRRGRPWASPMGNVYISIRLAQADTLGHTAHLSYVAAVALADALALLAPHVTVRLKWPNDVLVNGGKVSGILLETDGNHVIVGVGINVTTAPDAAAALYPPTSLRGEGADVTRGEVAYRFLMAFKPLLDAWRSGGMAAVRPYWMERAMGLGGPVTARLQNGEERHGTFVDLDGEGAMLLRGADGRIERILAGDIFFSASSGD